MQWRMVAENWPAFFDRIEERWPAADAEDLAAIDGDRKRFTAYISRLHDLTPGEAHEEIETWLQGDMPADIYMDEHHDNASITDSGRSIHPGEDVYSDDRLFGDDGHEEPPVGRA